MAFRPCPDLSADVRMTVSRMSMLGSGSEQGDDRVPEPAPQQCAALGRLGSLLTGSADCSTSEAGMAFSASPT